ncbi:MAG: ABC transporter substrate-binding protein [Ilumatobacteraceae bacterium]
MTTSNDGVKARVWTRREMLYSSGIVTAGALLAACGGGESNDAVATTTASTEPAPPGTEGATAGSTTTAPAEPWRIKQLLTTPGPSFANALHAVAEAQGFYRDNYVEVSTDYPGNSVKAIQTMIAGSGTIAAADSFALLVAAGEDLDVVSIYNVFRGYPFGFAVRNDSPIMEWAEDTVRGTRIGVTDFAGGEVPVLRGALARLGLAEGDGVEFVAIGYGGAETAEAIESGAVDIFAGSVVDFEIFRAAGVDVRVITPDYIQSFPGTVFATTPDLLVENSDGLGAFLRAQSQALVFLRANPEAAAEIAIAAAPASAEGVDVAFVAGFLEDLIVAGNEAAFDSTDPGYRLLGTQDSAAFDDYQKFLIETGTADDDGITLSREVDVAQYVDNSLVDVANDFDYDAIEALALTE